METKGTQNNSRLFLVIGIICVAFILTTPFSSAGPLIENIRTDLGMSHTAVSFVNTLPIFIIAISSPLASKVGNKIGIEISVMAGMVLIIIGLLFRSFGNIVSLFGGTIFLGIGISAGMTFMPSIIKKYFGDKVDRLTGIYALSASGSAAIASAISIPLAVGLNLGWRKALAAWAIVVLIAIIFWIPFLKNNRHDENKNTGLMEDKPILEKESELSFRKLLSLPLAWCIAIFMGLESFSFNGIITWLPVILQNRGISTYTSGMMCSFSQIVSLCVSFGLPFLYSRFKDQRWISVATCGIYMLGFLGLLLFKNLVLIVICLAFIGIGLGGTFSLAISFTTKRAVDPKSVAVLNGMTQSIGNLLGALGPFSIGLVFDITKSWNMSIIFFVVVTILQGLAGFVAGNNVYINNKGEILKNN